MKNIIKSIILLLVFIGIVRGDTYLVCATPGEPVYPDWTNIQTAVYAAGAGDRIHVYPGIYRESLIFSNSGTAENPIIIQGQGPGVIIDGSIELTTNLFKWTASTNANIWYLEDIAGGVSTLIDPGGVWIDDVYQFNGHYTSSWLTNNVQTIWATNFAWGDGNSLGFDTLYIFQTNNPNTSGAKIEVSQRSRCIYIYRESFITFENIEMRKSGIKTNVHPIAYLYEADNITFTNCRIHDASGQAGAIYVMRGANISILNSEIYNCYDPDGSGYGSLIFFESSNTRQCTNIVLKGNTIYNCYARLGDLFGCIGTWVSSVPYGAYNAIIENNEFYGYGQNGVYFRSGCNSNLVRNNYFHNIKGWETTGGIVVQLRDAANWNKVYNNLAINCYGPAMQSDGKNGASGSTNARCDGNEFYNNTLLNGSNTNTANGMHFFGDNTNLIVKNNITVSRVGDMILIGNATDVTWCGGATLSNNRYYKTVETGSEFVFRDTNYTTLSAMQIAMTEAGYPNEIDSTYGDPGFAVEFPSTESGAQLSSTSPCIDIGTNADWMVSALDRANKDRINQLIVDIGCFEYYITVLKPTSLSISMQTFLNMLR